VSLLQVFAYVVEEQGYLEACRNSVLKAEEGAGAVACTGVVFPQCCWWAEKGDIGLCGTGNLEIANSNPGLAEVLFPSTEWLKPTCFRAG